MAKDVLGTPRGCGAHADGPSPMPPSSFEASDSRWAAELTVYATVRPGLQRCCFRHVDCLLGRSPSPARSRPRASPGGRHGPGLSGSGASTSAVARAAWVGRRRDGPCPRGENAPIANHRGPFPEEGLDLIPHFPRGAFPGRPWKIFVGDGRWSSSPLASWGRRSRMACSEGAFGEALGLGR